jgi:hypothetical protein
MNALAASAEKRLFELLMATDPGMATDEFARIVKVWLAPGRHPKTKRPYTEMSYQPMVEVLAYLGANCFKTYIVSGGGIEFMRPWTERVYGMPPEQVVGRTIKTKFEMRGVKPVGINKFIGRRPILAFGNSDGDLQMLQWTAAGDGPRFMGLVHNTDADREWANDRQSSIGRLDKALDEAKAKGWTVVDMKMDWKVIYPFERP